jgi:hypothetical protein
VTNYFSVGDNDSAAPPPPAPPAAVEAPSVTSVKFAETSDDDDDDDSDGGSDDSAPPKIQLTEETVDLDGIADLDEKEEAVDIQVPESGDDSSLVLKL